jgi:hypothetical protein
MKIPEVVVVVVGRMTRPLFIAIGSAVRAVDNSTRTLDGGSTTFIQSYQPHASHAFPRTLHASAEKKNQNKIFANDTVIQYSPQQSSTRRTTLLTRSKDEFVYLQY